MAKSRIVVLLLITGLFSLGTNSFAQKLPKIREKFAPDSATFSLSVASKQDFSQGSTFEAKIHFKVGKHWHVYSSKSDAEASFPLKLGIPDDLANTFQLVGFEEKGKQ